MPAKRFLADFEVEAHGCLAEEGVVAFTHPRGEYEIHASNLAVEPGTDRPLLSFHMIVPGDDIELVQDVATASLKDFLHYLTFVTNLKYRIHRLVRVVDWTLGLVERECRQFENFPGHGLPFPALAAEHFRTIEALQQAELTPAFRRAMKWFSAGVGAEYFDDQFQFFWLVLELLAQISKQTEPVHDRCPTCQSELYCETCATHPTHRPYPKQAISQLIGEIESDDPERFFRLISDLRNAIMHGEELSPVLEKHNVEMAWAVNHIGYVAWVAILRTFGSTFEDAPPLDDLAFLKTNQYTHQTLTLAANLILRSSDPNAPSLSELAKPTISLHYSHAEPDEAETD